MDAPPTIVPANKASWADLQAIFGTTDYPGRCYCQHFKVRDSQWIPRRQVLPASAMCYTRGHQPPPASDGPDDPAGRGGQGMKPLVRRT
jgi:hypothetical protein